MQSFDSEFVFSEYHKPDNQKVVQAAALLVDGGRAGSLSSEEDRV